MKKLATFVLLAILSVSYSLPALAKTHKTHNKYKGIDKASRKAQEREQKAIDKYTKSLSSQLDKAVVIATTEICDFRESEHGVNAVLLEQGKMGGDLRNRGAPSRIAAT